MLKFKSLVVLSVYLAAQAASVPVAPTAIPVKIVYENVNKHQDIFGGRAVSRHEAVKKSLKNLDAKVQLSQEQLKKAQNLVVHPGVEKSNIIEEKLVQKTKDVAGKLGEVLPAPPSAETLPILPGVSDPASPSAETLPILPGVSDLASPPAETFPILPGASDPRPPSAETLPILPSVSDLALPPAETFPILPGASDPRPPSAETLPILPAASDPAPPEDASLPLADVSTNKPSLSPLQNPNVALILQLAQRVVYSGIESVKRNVAQIAEDQGEPPAITDAQWANFNKSIQYFFAAMFEQPATRATEEIICQDVVSGFRDVSNNFIESVKTNNATPTVGQNVVNAVAAGFQQIVSNLTNRAPGDSPPVSPPPLNPIQSIFQQVVGAGQNFLNPGSAGGQADDAAQPNPFQLFLIVVQQAANNVQQAIAQGTPAPGAQGDTPANNNPFQAFQGIVQQAVNNFQQAITSGGATPAPGAQGDTPTNPNPIQIFQGVIQQAVNSFQQGLNLGGATPAPGAQGDTPPNPVVQNFQSIVQQAVNALQQTIGGGATPAPGSQGDTPQQQGPVQQIQNAVGQAFNNFFNPSSQNNPPKPSGGVSVAGLVESGQNAAAAVGQIVQAGTSTTPEKSLESIPSLTGTIQDGSEADSLLNKKSSKLTTSGHKKSLVEGDPK